MNRLAFILLLVLFFWSTSGAQQESDGSSMSDDAPSEHQFAIRIPELEQTHYQSLDAGQGRYSFGYAFPDQMREESRSADGQVSGSYSYRDPNGNANQVQYRADKSGFRVTANNQPVQDTAEVAEARQKHLKIWEAIANHNRALQQRQQQQQRVNVQPAEAEPRSTKKESPFIDTDEEKELVAPAEPAPQAQPSDDKVVEASPEVISSAAIAEALNVQDTNKPLLINFDDIVDDEKEAVITAVDPVSSDPSVIEIDSEPVKLLAQLYAKHLENNKNPPSIIPRPEGFYPQITEPASGLDIFSRYDSSDKESIETINPEYIDLRAFLLTNRFKDAAGDAEQMKPAESSTLEGDELDILKNVMASQHFNNEPSDYDLLTSDEEDPDRYNNNNFAYGTGSYYPTTSQQLYNQYYNQDSDKPLTITRESWNELPESLKLAILGLGSVDGEHTAQVSPVQHNNKNQYPSYNTKQAAMPNIYSPYSSYYSPYYYYNHLRNYGGGGGAAAAAGYNSRPSYYPNKNYYGGYNKNPGSYYYQPYPYYYDNPYYYY